VSARARHVLATVAVALAASVAPRGRDAHAGEPVATPAPARTTLGRFTTTYAHDAEHHARAFNVELAAEAIDGRVLAPGTTFSFNDVVGERTAAFGFEKATVLRDRMIAEGTGGGTCQVASTLHAAALLAGLDVVARAPHSRPSGYIRMGLDATVVFGKVDLKLKNPRAASVVIHARAARGTLDVWLDGEGEKPAVTLTSEIVERMPFERAIERAGKGDRPVPPDTVRVKAFGIPGFRVQRTRVVRGADGGARREVHVDAYRPTGEVLLVAPDFDEARLGRKADDDDPDGPAPSPARPVVRDEGDAQKPTPLQLRPSTRVELDNSG
jgi:VanW like protein